MTRIKFIRGLPKPGDLVRVNDSPQQTRPKTYKNWLGKSEGEFYLQLLLDRVLIDKTYYGDYEGIYSMAENMLYNALSKGLHTAAGVDSFRSIPPEVNSVAAAIRSAKKKTKLAYTKIAVHSVAGPFDPYGNNSYEIDCFAFSQELQNLTNTLNNLPSSVPQSVRTNIQNQINEIQRLLDACNSSGRAIDILNDKLEESSHDFTYKYFTSQERNTQLPANVVNKANTHGAYVQNMANLVGLSGSNMSLWVDNGIKRQNTRGGTQPWNGRETGWGVGYSNLDGDTTRIGLEPFTVIALVSAGIKIIQQVVRAINEAKNMHGRYTPSEQFQLTQLIGSKPGNSIFDANKNDWAGFSLPLVDVNGNPIDPDPGGFGNGGGSDDSGNNGLLIGGGIALLAALFLSQNNN